LNSDLIINSTPGEVNIALLEEKQLVELNKDKKDQSFAVGDIYLGRVKKLIPSLNAAFVDIGHKKEAFLHYTDLGPKLKSLHKYTNSVLAGSQTAHRLRAHALHALGSHILVQALGDLDE